MAKITFERWPWQGWGWTPHKSGKSPAIGVFNASGARFGGGWRYKLGVDIGEYSLILNLLFGIVRIDWRK